MLPLLAAMVLTGHAPEMSSDAAVRSEPTSTVRWEAGPGCPTDHDLRKDIEHLLGQPLDQPRQDAVTVNGSIRTTEDDAWVLELTIASSTGSRTRLYTGSSCAELTDVAAVLIAVAIDPTIDSQLPRPQPEPTPEPEPEPEPEPPPPVENKAADPPAKDRALRGVVRVASGVSVGPLPSAAPGVQLGAGLLGRHFRVELTGAYWFAREARLAERPEVGGDIRTWALGLRGCGVLGVSLVEFPLCGAAEAGAMVGDGVGIDQPASGRLLWAAGLVGAGLWVVPIPQLAIGLDATLVVPITRTGFEIEGIGEVHRATPVGFYGLIGLEARIP